MAMAAASVSSLPAAGLPAAPDPREIVRKSVELDQNNWLRMKDYTWISRENTRRLDSAGDVKSTEGQGWETIFLFGKPYRKLVERNGQSLSADERHKEQVKIDQATEKLERESSGDRQRRIAKYAKQREKDREFLREVPDAFDLQLLGARKIDGRDTWEISARPKPGYQAKHGDAKAFAKIEGKIWIDQSESQWVRIEAKTIETISWGLCLMRLDPGATLLFEQTRVNDEMWLPKRELLTGSGRIVLLKQLFEQQETTWSDYRKFHVESNVVSTR